jgi:hypothetical protein
LRDWHHPREEAANADEQQDPAPVISHPSLCLRIRRVEQAYPADGQLNEKLQQACRHNDMNWNYYILFPGC